MSPPERNENTYQARKSFETRARILDAAIRVLAQVGLPDLTFDEVIRESGVTKGGVQYYFRTKEELILAMIDSLITEFLEDVAARAGGTEDPIAWTRALIDHAFESETGTKGAWRPLVDHMAEHPQVRPMADRVTGALYGNMRGAGLSEGQAAVLAYSAQGFITSPHRPPPHLGAQIAAVFHAWVDAAQQTSPTVPS